VIYLSEPSTTAATRTLSGERRMSIPMQPLNADFNGETFTWIIQDSASASWQIIPGGLVSGFYLEDYFDTSGYTNDKLTVFPENAYIQEAGRYQFSFAGNSRLLVFDLIMSERLNREELIIFTSDFIATNSRIPGTSNSTEDWSQVIYARLRELVGITQGTTVEDIFAPVSDQQWGSMEPTTADKLWTYKIILQVGTPDAFATIKYPASRVVLNADVRREDDAAYLMRQKRSYELTNY